MPTYRDDFLPLDTDYREREQNSRWAMSCNWAELSQETQRAQV